jgi:hypothetical protein
VRRNSQTRYLTRHFFDRFFDKDSISPGSDPAANVIQTLSMLAVPGLMLVFWMRFSPYFFISYSMIVMWFVMIFKWESLFPDRRDYLILGSLPIRYRDLFFSKVKALLIFLSMFALSRAGWSSMLAAYSRSWSLRLDWSSFCRPPAAGAARDFIWEEQSDAQLQILELN